MATGAGGRRQIRRNSAAEAARSGVRRSTDDDEDDGGAEDALEKHYRYDKVALVFDRLDVGGNGDISFAEFLTTVDTLSPDEIANARSAFEMLGPDKNGNVKKRKYIQMQIDAFEDVMDAEFERWVHIMTKGSIVHAHTRKELEAAGIEIPEDFIDPPTFSVVKLAVDLVRSGGTRFVRRIFARQHRQRVAAYEASATARRQHIKRMQKLKARLDAHDKTLLDDEHALAMAALQEKEKKRKTQIPPVELKRPSKKEELPKNRRRQRANNLGFSSASREEKSCEEGPKRGLKQGNEFAPLDYECSDFRIEHSRQLHRYWLEDRVLHDRGDSSDEEVPDEQPDSGDDDDDDDDDDDMGGDVDEDFAAFALPPSLPHCQT